MVKYGPAYSPQDASSVAIVNSQAPTTIPSTSENIQNPPGTVVSSAMTSGGEGKRSGGKDEPKQPFTFRENMGSETVELIVGKDKAKFLVHKKLLCDKIPYFDKMFNGGFEEARSKIATFSEDRAQSMDLLLGWVYHGSIRKIQGTNNNGVREIPSWSFVDMYSLAHKLCLRDVQDEVMDAYLTYSFEGESMPSFETWTSAYDKVLSPSPLRTLMVYFGRLALSFNAGEFATAFDVPSILELLFDNSDFGVDFLNLIRYGGAVEDPRVMPRCDFNCHGKDEPCYLTKKGPCT
ncbi:uncharacterized protein PAC_17031 [Phialocephala subalpina]|uniref:BTB domain-containing protein n=1 Tax=Phialocephala subalpina TaxID=576137 RepID=A0A1L7XQ02_9HELO|nr:uncharacterized protein PAC_17031 [Phialocephala subalpina]